MPGGRRVSLRESFTETVSRASQATLLQKRKWMSKARHLQSFDKMPLGHVTHKKPKSAQALASVESNPALILVGGVLFQLCYLLFWLAVPLPWQIPVTLFRRNNRPYTHQYTSLRRPARYLLAAGYMLNWTIAMLASLHFGKI